MFIQDFVLYELDKQFLHSLPSVEETSNILQAQYPFIASLKLTSDRGVVLTFDCERGNEQQLH